MDVDTAYRLVQWHTAIFGGVAVGLGMSMFVHLVSWCWRLIVEFIRGL